MCAGDRGMDGKGMQITVSRTFGFHGRRGCGTLCAAFSVTRNASECGACRNMYVSGSQRWYSADLYRWPVICDGSSVALIC